MKINPVHIDKEIISGDNLAKIILNSTDVCDGDILVIAQKIISKQEGRLVELSTVNPSLLSEGISSQYKKDPRVVELVLSESKRIVRMKNGLIITETKKDINLNAVMSNSFGFGGTNATLIFEKI